MRCRIGRYRYRRAQSRVPSWWRYPTPHSGRLIHFVIAGLDPAIHPIAKVLAKKMDPRVKPAGDACGCGIRKSNPPEYALAAAVAANISDLARYSAATRRALRTPRASSATRLTTAVTVFAVALSSRSRLALSALTSAEPTTTPSAPAAITAACSAVRTPKPIATGSLVWHLMRPTAAATFAGSGVAAPVMPVIET